jgi:hypothetical protein
MNNLVAFLKDMTLNKWAEIIAAILTTAGFLAMAFFVVAIAYRYAHANIPAQLFVDVSFFTLAFAFSLGCVIRVHKMEETITHRIEVAMMVHHRQALDIDASNYDMHQRIIHDVSWLIKKQQCNEMPAGSEERIEREVELDEYQPDDYLPSNSIFKN